MVNKKAEDKGEEPITNLMNKNKSGNITRVIKVSNFPQLLFTEWDEDCKARFNNCRWLKIMHDHNLSKIIPILSSVITRVEQLESQLQDLGDEPKEKKEGVKTFTGLRK